ncbi:MAG: energy-coupling factor transporter transmembrane protein EcfT [Desulfomonile tiedjei]|nr:energy-coupling factor transporter transmembrane protein EcfT [Desulfomonile tiedjei]
MSRSIMDLSIGGYVPGDSFLHRLDPRTKLLGMLSMLVGAFCSESLEAAAISVAAAAMLAALTGAGWRIWAWGLWRFKWMLLIVFLMNLFFHSSGAAPHIGPHQGPFSGEVVRSSLALSLRLISAIMVSLALTFTTTPREMTLGFWRLASPLKRLRVPVDEFGMIMMLAMRFIPLVQEELRNTIDAQKARGVDFGHGPIVSRARNLLALLVPALHGVLRRADHLAIAMTARGYRPGQPRTEYRPLRFSLRDLIALLLLLAFTALQCYQPVFIFPAISSLT